MNPSCRQQPYVLLYWQHLLVVTEVSAALCTVLGEHCSSITLKGTFLVCVLVLCASLLVGLSDGDHMAADGSIPTPTVPNV
jgi:hypothetical protein